MEEDQWEVEPHSCRWPFVRDFAIADIKQLVNKTNFIVVGGAICLKYLLLKKWHLIEDFGVIIDSNKPHCCRGPFVWDFCY